MIIAFVEGKAVTGYEVVNEAHVEAARLGLFGDDAVMFERISRQIGADVMATITKNVVTKSADEALNDLAGKRGRAFMLVDRLPTVEKVKADGRKYDDVDLDALTIDGGKVVLKAA